MATITLPNPVSTKRRPKPKNEFTNGQTVIDENGVRCIILKRWRSFHCCKECAKEVISTSPTKCCGKRAVPVFAEETYDVKYPSGETRAWNQEWLTPLKK